MRALIAVFMCVCLVASVSAMALREISGVTRLPLPDPLQRPRPPIPGYIPRSSFRPPTFPPWVPTAVRLTLPTPPSASIVTIPNLMSGNPSKSKRASNSLVKEFKIKNKQY